MIKRFIKLIIKLAIFLGLELCAVTCVIAGGTVINVLVDKSAHTVGFWFGTFAALSLILGGIAQFFAAFCVFYKKGIDPNE